MLGIMLMIVGSVSAACVSDDIIIVTPTANSYTNANTQLINWTLGSGCNSSTFSLRYSIGVCGNVENTLGMFASGETEYSWDISSLTTGQYCVKVYKATSTIVKKEVSFTIDRISPNVTFNNAPYSVIKENPVTISADIVDESNLSKYVIKFNSTDTGKEVALTSNPETISESYTYTESGEYIVTIIAYDKAGNTKTTTTNVVVSDKAPDWVISLYADKMNLFSIPLIPENSDIEKVLPESISDKAEKIWSYQKGKWKYNTPTSSGWSGTSTRIQEIVPGYGYILFMDEDSVAYGNGKELGADVPPEVTLTTGWNLIGHYGKKSNTTENALSSLELGDKYWHSVFKINDVGELESVSVLYPEKAYWLSIKGIDLDEDDELRFFKYLPSQDAY